MSTACLHVQPAAWPAMLLEAPGAVPARNSAAV